MSPHLHLRTTCAYLSVQILTYIYLLEPLIIITVVHPDKPMSSIRIPPLLYNDSHYLHVLWGLRLLHSM